MLGEGEDVREGQDDGDGPGDGNGNGDGNGDGDGPGPGARDGLDSCTIALPQDQEEGAAVGNPVDEEVVAGRSLMPTPEINGGCRPQPELALQQFATIA